MQNVRAIEFNENGEPVPVIRQPITGQRMTRLLASALTQPYKPAIDPNTGGMAPGEEDFLGLTNIEVGALRQADQFAKGDSDAAKFCFDRVAGKPKQQVEQLTVTASLQDYLQAMAASADNDMGFASDDDVDCQFDDEEVPSRIEAPASEPGVALAIKTGASHINMNESKYAALDGI